MRLAPGKFPRIGEFSGFPDFLSVDGGCGRGRMAQRASAGTHGCRHSVCVCRPLPAMIAQRKLVALLSEIIEVLPAQLAGSMKLVS